MQEEIMAIDNTIEEQRAEVGLGFWQPFKAVIHNKKVLWRFFLGGALFFWQNASGINAVNYCKFPLRLRLGPAHHYLSNGR
jgi:hypothetical protein